MYGRVFSAPVRAERQAVLAAGDPGAGAAAPGPVPVDQRERHTAHPGPHTGSQRRGARPERHRLYRLGQSEAGEGRGAVCRADGPGAGHGSRRHREEGVGHQPGRRHAEAPAAPGDGAADQAHEGRARRRGLRRAERAVPRGGEQALLSDGGLCHPTAGPDHHRRRRPGRAGAVHGPLPLRQGRASALPDRRQGPRPGLW